MKLKDVIEAVGDRTDWIQFYSSWKLTDSGKVVMTFPSNITLNSDVDIHYQWFWHCNPSVDTTEIYNAIRTHDYTTFTKWFEALESELPFVYLPNDAEIWINDEYLGSVCVAFNEKTFRLITSQDHECG